MFIYNFMINDHSDKYAHEWEDTACRMIDDICDPLVVSLQAALEAEIEDPHTSAMHDSFP